MKSSSQSRYIKGPHPKASIPPKSEIIKEFLSLGWIFQQKINGRRIQIHIPRCPIKEIICYTRQGSLHTIPLSSNIQDVIRAYYAPKQGEWNVLEGEFVPQLDKVFLFDVLVHEDKLLTHLNFKSRHSLLKRAFISPYLSILKTFTSIKDAVRILAGKEDWIEGIIFKSDSIGFDDRSVVRCRKAA